MQNNKKCEPELDKFLRTAIIVLTFRKRKIDEQPPPLAKKVTIINGASKTTLLRQRNPICCDSNLSSGNLRNYIIVCAYYCAKGGSAAKNHGKSQAQNSRDLRELKIKEENSFEKRT